MEEGHWDLFNSHEGLYLIMWFSVRGSGVIETRTLKGRENVVKGGNNLVILVVYL